MGALIRIVMLISWALGAGWLWRSGVLEGTLALAVAAVGLFALLLPRSRRRRGALRYVEMTKQPLGAA